LPAPILTFSLVLSTLMSAVFHLIVGGGGRRLVLFLLAGWLGFFIGHGLGYLFEVNVFNIGALYFFPALLGGILALFVTHILTNREPTPTTTRRRARKRATR